MPSPNFSFIHRSCALFGCTPLRSICWKIFWAALPRRGWQLAQALIMEVQVTTCRGVLDDVFFFWRVDSMRFDSNASAKVSNESRWIKLLIQVTLWFERAPQKDKWHSTSNNGSLKMLQRMAWHFGRATLGSKSASVIPRWENPQGIPDTRQKPPTIPWILYYFIFKTFFDYMLVSI